MTTDIPDTTIPTHAILIALALHGALSTAELVERLTAWGYDITAYDVSALLTRPRQRGAVVPIGEVKRGRAKNRPPTRWELTDRAPYWARLIQENGVIR